MQLKKTDCWEELGKEEQKELELAIKESYNEEELVDHKLVLKEVKVCLEE